MSESDTVVMTGGPPTAEELTALRRAARLADRGATTVLPNPVVGCVVISADHRIVGEGHHTRAGGPHAEVVALRQAGDRAVGATAVVTLEPCNHTGRTGPCTRALLEAGITRVVVAVRDPWPGAGGGVEALRAAGVQVVEVAAAPTDEARRLVEEIEDGNRVWLTAVRRGRPFVTWKAGMTVDGRVAAADGTSRWITSAAARADVHALRARVDTVLVGIGTVLADDPQLTVRDAQGGLTGVSQPLRVVADTDGRTPVHARVLDASAETWVVTGDEVGRDAEGHVNVLTLLHRLFERGRRHVLLEGGPRLAAAVLDAGLVDEAVIYVAPLLLGYGRPALAGGSVRTLADAHRAELRDVARIGPDVRLRYRMLH